MFYVLCALTLLSVSTSYGEGGNAADDCTSGFMSVDRMDDILGNDGSLMLDYDYTAIFPEVSFTSSGSIRSWIFGGQWEGNSGSFTELQIWSGADGSYTKVGSTTIMTEQNSSQLYHYPLSSPLPFQAGDILGCSQPPQFSSQLILGYEEEGRGRQLGYYISPRTNSDQLTISGPGHDQFQLLVNAITDPPGCGRGFMSVERMRLILNIEMPEDLVSTESRQQITPDMKFTCDGMITKWIITAFAQPEENQRPELQVWRNIGNDIYQKINGTFIEPETLNHNSIYEYDSFSPIPIKSGDILGIFIPAANSSRLALLSENTDSRPTNYYLTTGQSSESPYDTFDIQSIPPVIEAEYWPMVTVEIVRDTTVIPSSTSQVSMTPSPIFTTPTTQSLSSLATSPPPSPDGSSSSLAAGIGGGIAAALVMLLVLVVGVLVVLFILKTRRKEAKAEVVELKQDENGVDGLDNPVYTASPTGEVSGRRVAPHQKEVLYESPQNEEERRALYDVPPDVGGEYAEVHHDQMNPSTTSPETYIKFDNPIYEQN